MVIQYNFIDRKLHSKINYWLINGLSKFDFHMKLNRLAVWPIGSCPYARQTWNEATAKNSSNNISRSTKIYIEEAKLIGRRNCWNIISTINSNFESSEIWIFKSHREQHSSTHHHIIATLLVMSFEWIFLSPYTYFEYETDDALEFNSLFNGVEDAECE